MEGSKSEDSQGIDENGDLSQSNSNSNMKGEKRLRRGGSTASLTVTRDLPAIV